MMTYRAYKEGLRGLQDVSETVKAVEKIAASRVHRLRKKVERLRTYRFHLETTLKRFVQFYRPEHHPLLQLRTGGQRTMVLISADTGLVGGLWHVLVNRLLQEHVDGMKVVVIGEKGASYLAEEGISVAQTFPGFPDVHSQEYIQSMTKNIFDLYVQDPSCAGIDILYPAFVSLSQHDPVLATLLPFSFTLSADAQRPAEGLPLFEPSRPDLFTRLLHKYISVVFHTTILEAKLSELSARTVETEQATEKTEDFIADLQQQFRKDRRRTITQRQQERFSARHVSL